MNPRVPASDRPNHHTHYAALRGAVAVPAMTGSLLLFVVVFGWAGSWEGPILTVWLISGACLLTRVGERAALAVSREFTRPDRDQLALVAPAWDGALSRAHMPAGAVDLYLQRTGRPNACAIGRRSVAVSDGLLNEFLTRRLSSQQFEAVLVHELGHHATRATRFDLVTAWLAAPARVVTRVAVGLSLATVGRRQPPRLLAGTATAAVVVAVVQTAERGQPITAAVLTAIGASLLLGPLAAAHVSRRCEYAADRFTARCGAGPDLISALHHLDTDRTARTRRAASLLDRHPTLDRRAAAIESHIRVAGQRHPSGWSCAAGAIPRPSRRYPTGTVTRGVGSGRTQPKEGIATHTASSGVPESVRFWRQHDRLRSTNTATCSPRRSPTTSSTPKHPTRDSYGPTAPWSDSSALTDSSPSGITKPTPPPAASSPGPAFAYISHPARSREPSSQLTGAGLDSTQAARCCCSRASRSSPATPQDLPDRRSGRSYRPSKMIMISPQKVRKRPAICRTQTTPTNDRRLRKPDDSRAPTTPNGVRNGLTRYEHRPGINGSAQRGRGPRRQSTSRGS